MLLLLNYTLGHLPAFLENNLILGRSLKWDHVAQEEQKLLDLQSSATRFPAHNFMNPYVPTAQRAAGTLSLLLLNCTAKRQIDVSALKTQAGLRWNRVTDWVKIKLLPAGGFLWRGAFVCASELQTTDVSVALWPQQPLRDASEFPLTDPAAKPLLHDSLEGEFRPIPGQNALQPSARPHNQDQSGKKTKIKNCRAACVRFS